MKYYNVLILFSVIFFTSLFAQWEGDQRLTNTPSNSFLGNNNAWGIAASGDTLHVIYRNDQTGSFQIYYTSSFNGGVNWNVPVMLNSESNNLSIFTMAVSGSTVHTIWTDAMQRMFLYRRSINAGVAFSQLDTILTTTQNFGDPCLAASGNNVYLVWSDNRNPVNNDEIYFMNSTNGGTSWNTPQRITNTANGITDKLPSIAVNGNNLHIVWQRGPDYHARALYLRSTNNGTSWETERFFTSDTINQIQPCIAVSGNYVHTVWTDIRYDTVQIFYRSSQDNGSNWQTEYNLSQGFSADYQTIAAIGKNVHVAWRDYRFNQQWHIGYRRSFDNGQTWQLDTVLIDGWHQESPSIAVAGEKVHLIWIDNRNGNWEIYYKRNPSGSGIEEENRDLLSINRMSFEVFPNPAKTYFTICLPQSADHSQITIFDVSGKVVKKLSIINSREKILLDKMHPGIYFFRIGNAVVLTKLIITK